MKRVLSVLLAAVMIVCSTSVAYAEPVGEEILVADETAAIDEADITAEDASEVVDDAYVTEDGLADTPAGVSDDEALEDPVAEAEDTVEATEDAEAENISDDADTVSADEVSEDAIPDEAGECTPDAGDGSLPAEYLREGATNIEAVEPSSYFMTGALGTNVKSKVYSYKSGGLHYQALYIWTSEDEAYLNGKVVDSDSTYKTLKNSLTDIIIEDGITEIQTANVFSGLSKVSLVRLPSDLKAISNGAFMDCTSLEFITIPKTLQEAHRNTFNGCVSLKSITFENGIKRIPDYFACGGDGSADVHCGLRSVFIPPSVTEIGESAFCNLRDLENVVFTDASHTTLSFIGQRAFYRTNLSGISLPKFGGKWHDSIKNKYYTPIIESHAFAGTLNSSFKTLVIPEGVVTVHNLWDDATDVFGQHGYWTEIYLPSTLKRVSNDQGDDGCLQTFNPSNIRKKVQKIYYNGTEDQFLTKTLWLKSAKEKTNWKTSNSEFYPKFVWRTAATQVSTITVNPEDMSIVNYYEDIPSTGLTKEIELTVSPATHMATEYKVTSTNVTIASATLGEEANGKLPVTLEFPKTSIGTALVTISGGQASATIKVTTKEKDRVAAPAIKINGTPIESTTVTVKNGDLISAESDTRDCNMEYRLKSGVWQDYSNGLAICSDIMQGAEPGDTLYIEFRAEKEGFLPSNTAGPLTLEYALDMGDADIYDLESSLYVPEGMWISKDYISEPVYTGGQITYPDVSVFYYNKLLKKGKDYTLKYSDNVDSKAVSGKDAAIIAVGKGIYKGKTAKAYFAIQQFDINPSIGLQPKLDYTPVTLKGTGNPQTPNIAFTCDGRKMVLGKDYKATYEAGIYHNLEQVTDSYSYVATVQGIGNYTGTKSLSGKAVYVTDPTSDGVISMADVTVTKIAPQQLVQPGTPVTPDFKVFYKKKEIPKGFDMYTVEYKNNDVAGTATITLRGNGNTGPIDGKTMYCKGAKTFTFKIKPISLSKADVSFSSTYTYTGQPHYTYPGVKVGERILSGLTDFNYTMKNNTNAGNATVTITGKGSYTGRKTVRVPIAKATLTDPMVSLDAGSYNYTVGGVKPAVKVVIAGTTLPSKDYKLTYTNNTAPGAATVKITGKGNLTGEVTKNFTVTAGDLSRCKTTVPDKFYANKTGVYTQKLTIKDTNGKKLVAGRDYEKVFMYQYTGDTLVRQKTGKKTYDSFLRRADQVVDPKDIIPGGTAIRVTVTGKGNYAGSELAATYRIGKKKISSVGFSIKPQDFTGVRILPGKNRITVTFKGEEDAHEIYEIISYGANTKKGTGTVTVRGRGDYAGTKVIKFKIQ